MSQQLPRSSIVSSRFTASGTVCPALITPHVPAAPAYTRPYPGPPRPNSARITGQCPSYHTPVRLLSRALRVNAGVPVTSRALPSDQELGSQLDGSSLDDLLGQLGASVTGVWQNYTRESNTFYVRACCCCCLCRAAARLPHPHRWHTNLAPCSAAGCLMEAGSTTSSHPLSPLHQPVA